MASHILAIDQGTTSSRAIVFDGALKAVATGQQEFAQHYPQPGHVEHDPEDLWRTVMDTTREALGKAGIAASALAGIGITNQRETVVVWERSTGRPIHKAIVWQDRRTSATCARLRAEGHEKLVMEWTGLLLDPYFSATKIAHILDAVPGARERAARGEVLFGTVDSFLLFRLTGGRVHATDATNASRTSLFDIRKGAWDADLLKLFNVPAPMLPEVKDCSGAVRHDRRECLWRRRAHPRHRRRPAGRHRRPGLLQAGHAEIDLRHGLFRAAQHRRRCRHLEKPHADDHRLPAGRQTHLCA